MAVSSSLCVRMLTAGCDGSDSDWLDKNGSVNSSRLLPVVCICTCFIDDLCANRSAFYPTRPHFMITSPRLTHVRITSCSRHVHVSSRSCSRQLTLMFTSAHAHVHVSSRSRSRRAVARALSEVQHLLHLNVTDRLVQLSLLLRRILRHALRFRQARVDHACCVSVVRNTDRRHSRSGF